MNCTPFEITTSISLSITLYDVKWFCTDVPLICKCACYSIDWCKCLHSRHSVLNICVLLGSIIRILLNGNRCMYCASWKYKNREFNCIFYMCPYLVYLKDNNFFFVYVRLNFCNSRDKRPDFKVLIYDRIRYIINNYTVGL